MRINQRTKRLCMASLAVLVVLAMAHARPTGGTISGKVTYEGTPAKSKTIDMSKEPSCAQQHATPVTTETVVTGPNNSLENVVVYISAGAPDESAPSQPVKFDQKGCQYLPHVLAFQVNQPLEITNSDQTSHNIHPQATKNSEWNKSQLAGAAPMDVTWNNEEVAIPVKCNVHPWMRAYIVVVKGPYGMSDESGAFKLDNLAPGNYTLTAWHETYGTQTQTVTVAAGKPATVSFTFKAK